MKNHDLLKEFRSSYSQPSSTKMGPKPLPRRKVIFGIATAAITTGVFGVVATRKPETVPPVPSVLRLLLLDSSDRNTASSDRNITQFIERSVGDIRVGDRLILLEMTANQLEPVVQRFNAVSPPRGQDVSGWNSSPYEIEAKWQMVFKNPYLAKTRLMREVQKKPQTPFLEALMDVSRILRAYDADRKEVIVISDALQHENGGLSAYSAVSSTRNVYAMPTPATEFYTPDFQRAYFTLLHIQRNDQKHRQGERQRNWLQDVIENRNATLEYIPV